MLKKIFQILVWAFAILAAFVGISMFKKSQEPEYIEIYSTDNDDLLF